MTPETYDPWDIWSGRWGDMTWPKRQWQRQIQRQRQWQRQIQLETSFRASQVRAFNCCTFSTLNTHPFNNVLAFFFYPTELRNLELVRLFYAVFPQSTVLLIRCRHHNAARNFDLHVSEHPVTPFSSMLLQHCLIESKFSVQRVKLDEVLWNMGAGRHWLKPDWLSVETCPRVSLPMPTF